MDELDPVFDLPELSADAWGEDSWDQALEAFADEIPPPESDDPLGDLIASIDASIAAEAPEARADRTPKPDVMRRGRLVFSLSNERYAAPIERIVRLDRLGRLTPTPNTPAWVLGVANVRGHIVPVLDLRSLLGLPAAATDTNTRRLVQLKGSAAGLVAGVVVDALHGIRTFDDDSTAADHPRTLDVDGLFESEAIRELMSGWAGGAA